MRGEPKSYNFIDLFAGAGGFSEGFLQCEYKNKSFNFLLASDVHRNSELTHRMRYNKQLGLKVDFVRKDITDKDFPQELDEKLEGARIDVVCGGPPCQSFSSAGERRENDERDYLFKPFLKTVEQLEPKFFVIENVPGILTKHKGELVEELLQYVRSMNTSENQGYQIENPLVVNASDYGVPQNRGRVLLIGCREDQDCIRSISPVTRANKVTVEEALHDLVGIETGEKLGKYPRKPKKDLPRRLPNGKRDGRSKSYAARARGGRLKQAGQENKHAYVSDTDDLSDLDYSELQNHQAPLHQDHVRERYKIIRKFGGFEKAKGGLKERGLLNNKQNYKLLKKDEPAPTVMTIPDDLVHYSSNRTLTVRELARLQSFDDSFVFQGKRTTGGKKRRRDLPQYTLVGNAVPPLVARAIGREILKNIR